MADANSTAHPQQIEDNRRTCDEQGMRNIVSKVARANQVFNLIMEMAEDLEFHDTDDDYGIQKLSLSILGLAGLGEKLTGKSLDMIGLYPEHWHKFSNENAVSEGGAA